MGDESRLSHNRIVGEAKLLTLASHDLRTPLAIIQGYGQLLEGGLAPEADPLTRESVTTILAYAKSLQYLIESLVALEQIGRGALRVSAARLDLNKLAETALAEIGGLLTIKGVSVARHLSSTPIWVGADENHVVRALYSLLAHAEKAAQPDGELRLEVAGNGDFGWVWLTDPARSLTAESATHLFDLEEVTDRATRRDIDLGLLAARYVAEAHGGNLTARSASGEGLVLALYLPRADEAATEGADKLMADFPEKRNSLHLASSVSLRATLNSPPEVPWDEETWRQLPEFLANLPESVCLHVWADEAASVAEREAARLAGALAERFPLLSYRVFPRRVNYPYYPVIGVMAGTAEASVDLGLRFIGLPIGYQMTSLIAAIQAVAFRGQTLEPLTRIKLRRLSAAATGDIAIEVLTSAEDETGAMVAKAAFGAAAADERVRAYLIVTDFFPEAALRYSAAYLPHTVINKRVHFNGLLDEEALLRQIALAIRPH